MIQYSEKMMKVIFIPTAIIVNIIIIAIIVTVIIYYSLIRPVHMGVSINGGTDRPEA